MKTRWTCVTELNCVNKSATDDFGLCCQILHGWAYLSNSWSLNHDQPALAELSYSSPWATPHQGQFTNLCRIVAPSHHYGSPEPPFRNNRICCQKSIPFKYSTNAVHHTYSHIKAQSGNSRPLAPRQCLNVISFKASAFHSVQMFSCPADFPH